MTSTVNAVVGAYKPGRGTEDAVRGGTGGIHRDVRYIDFLTPEWWD
jgi:hypothetical protein